MTQSPAPPGQDRRTASRQAGARTAVRLGLWNYATDRWAPRDQPARLIFEIAIMLPFVVVLAIVITLSQG
jgi:hypothetical protein